MPPSLIAPGLFASCFTAAASEVLILSQCSTRPERYDVPRRFEPGRAPCGPWQVGQQVRIKRPRWNRLSVVVAGTGSPERLWPPPRSFDHPPAILHGTTYAIHVLQGSRLAVRPIPMVARRVAVGTPISMGIIEASVGARISAGPVRPVLVRGGMVRSRQRLGRARRLLHWHLGGLALRLRRGRLLHPVRLALHLHLG
jgi:hypothetical protein